MTLVLAACGSRTAGAPPRVDPPARAATGSVPAAAYDVTKSGRPVAEVDIFGRGVYQTTEQTVVAVGVAVRGMGEMVELDPALFSVEIFTSDGATAIARLVGLDPDGVGSRRVAKGLTRELVARFAVGRDLRPEDVNGFRLRWGILGSDGRRSVQYTFFAPDHQRAQAVGVAFVPSYGWYDPSLAEPSEGRAQNRERQQVRQVVVVPARMRD